MQQRRFGSVSRPVPVIGQGTWNMEGDDKAGVLAALRRGVALGMTHVDTAELYGSGRVESLIAPVIAESRDTLFLVSKVMPQNASRKARLPPAKNPCNGWAPIGSIAICCTGPAISRWPIPSARSNNWWTTARSCPGAFPISTNADWMRR